MSNFVSNSLNKITFHTLLLVGGVFLKKNKKNYKYAHNDLTILFKRATMQSTKKLNDDFFSYFWRLFLLKTPRITILEYELIINKKLYDQGVITEQQYDEVCKIIYEKISRCSKEVKSC